MSTLIRAELSPDNKYFISKDRYYELKHFCLQYKEWKQKLLKIQSCPYLHNVNRVFVRGSRINDPTARMAIQIGDLNERISSIEECASEADAILAPYILRAVTEGLSFTYLKGVLDIPCERDMYYDRYRKFFWLLSGRR